MVGSGNLAERTAPGADADDSSHSRIQSRSTIEEWTRTRKRSLRANPPGKRDFFVGRNPEGEGDAHVLRYVPGAGPLEEDTEPILQRRPERQAGRARERVHLRIPLHGRRGIKDIDEGIRQYRFPGFGEDDTVPHVQFLRYCLTRVLDELFGFPADTAMLNLREGKIIEGESLGGRVVGGEGKHGVCW